MAAKKNTILSADSTIIVFVNAMKATAFDSWKERYRLCYTIESQFAEFRNAQYPRKHGVFSAYFRKTIFSV